MKPNHGIMTHLKLLAEILSVHITNHHTSQECPGRRNVLLKARASQQVKRIQRIVPCLSRLQGLIHITGDSRRKKRLPQTVQDLFRENLSTSANMHMKNESLTCKAKVLEGLFVSFQVIIDAEPLVILVQCTEFSEERKIFSWVLKIKDKN